MSGLMADKMDILPECHDNVDIARFSPSSLAICCCNARYPGVFDVSELDSIFPQYHIQGAIAPDLCLKVLLASIAWGTVCPRLDAVAEVAIRRGDWRTAQYQRLCSP
jgi:hypothetical protein